MDALVLQNRQLREKLEEMMGVMRAAADAGDSEIAELQAR